MRIHDPKFSMNPRIHPTPAEVKEFFPETTQKSFPISTHEKQSPSDLSLEFRLNVSLTYMSFTLPSGRPAIMLDIGSVGNIAGSKWIQMVLKYAAEHGFKAQRRGRLKPLTVSGVGHGCQQATRDYRLPCAFLTGEGADPTDRSRSKSSFHASLDMPSPPESETPGLLGLSAMRKFGVVSDTRNTKLYVNMKGNVDFDLLNVLPSGHREIQCHIAPTGHMMAPCCEYTQPKANAQLAFAVQQKQAPTPHSPPPTHVPAGTPAPVAPPPPPDASAD